jgi:hypothetical protein
LQSAIDHRAAPSGRGRCWVFKFAALVQRTTVRGKICRGLSFLFSRMLACAIGYLA